MRALKPLTQGFRGAQNSYKGVATVRRRAFSASAQSMQAQRCTPASYYRGGTSRALIFQPSHLPKDRSKWPSLFLQVMGSPDPYGRQLDGMGAGISSLSKICLVEPSSRDDADVDYTFVGIGIEKDEVDMAGNCGNMSSAIGPYAFNQRLLKGRDEGGYDEEGFVEVRIHNTNTGVIIRSTFPVFGGQAQVAADYSMDGVSGTGAKIQLDFLKPGGAKTGKLLPTGNVVDEVAGIEASLVDAANPCVFVRAEDIDVPGSILPNDFNKLPEELELLERIRKAGAVKMGLVSREEDVPRTIPKIGLISRSSTHKILLGNTIEDYTIDVLVRFISDTQPHRAIPLTAALCTGVAAKILGSIVEQHLGSKTVKDGMLTIGHSSGRIEVNATLDDKGDAECATVFRTARRIFEGEVYWSDLQDREEYE